MKKYLFLLFIALTLSACTKAPDKVNYRVEDYVTITEIDGKSYCSTDLCRNSQVPFEPLYEIEFHNLEDAILNDFMNNHRYFIDTKTNQKLDEIDYRKTNEFIYEINDGLLSVLEIQSSTNNIPYSLSTTYGIIIDLKTQKVLNNQEILEALNLNLTDVYKEILQDSVSTIHIDFLLQSAIGDVEAPRISLDTFKENIPEYAQQLNDVYETPLEPHHQSGTVYEAVIYYFENGTFKASYDTGRVLRLLVFGSHMGIGIDSGYHTVHLK